MSFSSVLIRSELSRSLYLLLYAPGGPADIAPFRRVSRSSRKELRTPRRPSRSPRPPRLYIAMAEASPSSPTPLSLLTSPSSPLQCPRPTESLAGAPQFPASSPLCTAIIFITRASPAPVDLTPGSAALRQPCSCPRPTPSPTGDPPLAGAPPPSAAICRPAASVHPCPCHGYVWVRLRLLLPSRPSPRTLDHRSRGNAGEAEPSTAAVWRKKKATPASVFLRGLRVGRPNSSSGPAGTLSGSSSQMLSAQFSPGAQCALFFSRKNSQGPRSKDFSYRKVLGSHTLTSFSP